MLSIGQVILPLAAVGSVDDSDFTVGNHSQWADVFIAQIRASRLLGTLCRGRVYVAPDVAVRMYGASWGALQDFGEWNSPLSMQPYSSEYDRMEVFADLALAEGTVRIE